MLQRSANIGCKGRVLPGSAFHLHARQPLERRPRRLRTRSGQCGAARAALLQTRLEHSRIALKDHNYSRERSTLRISCQSRANSMIVLPSRNSSTRSPRIPKRMMSTKMIVNIVNSTLRCLKTRRLCYSRLKRYHLKRSGRITSTSCAVTSVRGIDVESPDLITEWAECDN